MQRIIPKKVTKVYVGSKQVYPVEILKGKYYGHSNDVITSNGITIYYDRTWKWLFDKELFTVRYGYNRNFYAMSTKPNPNTSTIVSGKWFSFLSYYTSFRWEYAPNIPPLLNIEETWNIRIDFGNKSYIRDYLTAHSMEVFDELLNGKQFYGERRFQFEYYDHDHSKNYVLKNNDVLIYIKDWSEDTSSSGYYGIDGYNAQIVVYLEIDKSKVNDSSPSDVKNIDYYTIGASTSHRTSETCEVIR